jgi:hypothetical protein
MLVSTAVSSMVETSSTGLETSSMSNLDKLLSATFSCLGGIGIELRIFPEEKASSKRNLKLLTG